MTYEQEFTNSEAENLQFSGQLNTGFPISMSSVAAAGRLVIEVGTEKKNSWLGISRKSGNQFLLNAGLTFTFHSAKCFVAG